MNKNSWFEVSKTGLAKILERKGKEFILFEPIQNAWDEQSTKVNVCLSHTGTGRVWKLRVEDDNPDGFTDLNHAFTLFAESAKKINPEKRGRFNIGEKLVLAICKESSITTTRGSVYFCEDGTRKIGRKHTESGSIFDATFLLTKKEQEEIFASIKTLIVPEQCETYFNGERILNRKSVASFEEKLPTEIADKEGNLKPTIRKTIVNIYEPKKGEKATLYEMGIPVVETGDTFHVDVQQKIPLNMDRDNIKPSYLKTIRTYVLNNTWNIIKPTDANETWIKEATSDERVEKDAFNKLMDLRHGKKRVIYDPNDKEANKIAFSKGYNVISGRSLSSKEWHNNRRFGSTSTAGKVTPSASVLFSPTGTSPLEKDKLTNSQKMVIDFTTKLAKELMNVNINVKIYKSLQGFSACYGQRTLCFNLKKLGHKFFNNFPNNMERILDLLIHEFGHEYSSDHLSESYYRALTKLGSKCTILALKEPGFFKIS